MSNLQTLLALACLLFAVRGWALDDADIPTDAPQDAVMASAEEVQEMLDWASAAFTGARSPGRMPAVRVELLRQDHSALRFGESCMETPLQIGKQEFKRGLGTHANSEIALHLPAGAREFRAFAGIDNNFDTQGQLGSAQFSVEIDGKEVFRTPTLKGGQAPVPVTVPLPPSTRAITLKVNTTAGVEH